MAFGQFQSSSADAKPLGSIADINVTPMVDVMLVLLVIFIIAAPLMTSAIRLDLPKTPLSSPVQTPSIAPLRIAIDAAGQLYLNEQSVTPEVLESRLAVMSKQAVLPEIQLRADQQTRYEIIARIMAMAQAQGLTSIAFVTESTGQSNTARP